MGNGNGKHYGAAWLGVSNLLIAFVVLPTVNLLSPTTVPAILFGAPVYVPFTVALFLGVMFLAIQAWSSKMYMIAVSPAMAGQLQFMIVLGIMLSLNLAAFYLLARYRKYRTLRMSGYSYARPMLSP